ncbi:DNA replication factor Cdt1 [Anopheles bellator]|uniref:DNA replication factor Cdt1 n=1 Tax=Anopheles bellator TaxID=139047 RepID=UPI0026488C79|nr:DNA replication factor Cdt1 [Anopheles bellator]
MSQPTVASYFNTRKRAAVDHLGGAQRNKVLLLDNPAVESIGNLTNSSQNSDDHEKLRYIFANTTNFSSKNNETDGKSVVGPSDMAELGRRVTRASRAIKRIGTVDLDEKTITLLSAAQPKLVSFIKKGNLSPQKRHNTTNSPAKQPVELMNKLASPKKPTDGSTQEGAEFSSRDTNKQLQKQNKANEVAKKSTLANTAKANDALGAARGRLISHPRLPEFKSKMDAIQKGMSELKRLQKQGLEGKPKPAVNAEAASKNLKEFASLEMEVMVSPKKTFTTPTKMLKTPTKNSTNMNSATKNVTPTRHSALMSPIKDPSAATPVTASPKKVPAYQRYHALTIPGLPTLHLPYKYRSLLELFKCIDTVVAMFHNRKEQITFKKLKPAVQRMARKNFYESHLAQIKHLYPDAFLLSQEMTKNYGSATKHETYQLVIRPNIQEKSTEGKEKHDASFLRTLQNQAMNSQVMIERQQRFHRLLLEKAKDAHQEFLSARDPPLTVEREKIVRWHEEFDVESACPDIEQVALPQPPNVEKFSSAKDILSTARNLFNCGTPLERALQRLEEKKRQAATTTATANLSIVDASEHNKPSVSVKPESTTRITADYNVLKTIPKALLEKIRAKQAAKALDQMTRRPSQEKEAIKYGRLPELARHIRNVFVTERKNVLPLETPLVKIENSYRGKLTLQELEEHIRLIAQLVPFWLTLPEVRKVKYAKIAKDCDLSKVIGVLEQKANEAVQ